MRYRRLLGATAALPLVLALPAASGGAAPSGAPAPQGSAFFLTQPSSAPAEEIALAYLRDNAADFDVTAGDLEELVVLSQSTSELSGVTHVNIVQHLQGLQVVGGHGTVNVTKDGSVLHVAAGFVPGVAEARAAATARVTPVEALESAAETLDIEGTEDAEAGPSARSAEQTTTVETQAAEQPVEARKVWQPTPDGLRLAWELVIDEAEETHLWRVIVDAATGETLATEDWTDHHDAHDLAAGLARDPQVFASARASGAALSAQASSWLGGSSSPVLDGSSYQVFAFPKESPNDGGMTVVENPADSMASPFGWHDTDGADGAEHTTTRGNNAHAYTDQDFNGVPDTGSDPDGGAGLTFEFDADLTEHAQAYREAAVTNLFYANNIIHDVLYRFGFDEASGNFQVDNYGRGGTGGDDVRAEAADGGGTNNANFSTPAADGGRPRMQMYLWPGNQYGAQNTVTVGAGDAAVSYAASWSQFTPPATNAGLSAPLVDVADPCVPFDAPGAIAVLPVGPIFGTCSSFERVQSAQAGGAVGVIAYGGDSAPILRSFDSMIDPVSIPAVTVSESDGEALRDAAAAGAAADVHKASSHPGIRDGDFENGIIIHEYGHGVSNRLTGGLNINCLSGDEQMGEGWSDFLAISMLIDPALDDPEGARGMGPYALFQDDRSGNGIRPRPYSRTMEIQPFTYDRIKTEGWITGGSLARPHGIGHAWAATLWDLTWDLVDRHGFEPDLYAGWDAGGNTRAIQYVMDGLKMQGCAPGFVAGRDGILAAAEALGGQDTCTIWSAFARRGLGYSAVQGSTGRDDNTEAFDLPQECLASGAGMVGAQVDNPPAVNTVNAGRTVPVQFSLGSDRGLDVLKDAQSPAYQQVDCETLEPVQFATTQPTSTTGNRALTYHARQDRYQYNWKTDESWAGTCQELQVILDDGTQHRAWFAFE